MSQKVHVKSVRTSIWESSSTAIYAETTRLNLIWAHALRYGSLLYSFYGKGYAYKGMKGRHLKKPIYHFPYIPIRINHANYHLSPVLVMYPRIIRPSQKRSWRSSKRGAQHLRSAKVHQRSL